MVCVYFLDQDTESDCLFLTDITSQAPFAFSVMKNLQSCTACFSLCIFSESVFERNVILGPLAEVRIPCRFGLCRELVLLLRFLVVL